MTGFVQHNPGDGLGGNTSVRPPGSGSNFQAGTPGRDDVKHVPSTSHLDNAHAAGSSEAIADRANAIVELTTMGK